MLKLDDLLVLAVTYKEQIDSSVAVNCKNLCRIISLYHHPGIPLCLDTQPERDLNNY